MPPKKAGNGWSKKRSRTAAAPATGTADGYAANALPVLVEQVLGSIPLLEQILARLPTNADLARAAGVNKMFSTASKSPMVWNERADRLPTLTGSNTNINLPLLQYRTKKHVKAFVTLDESQVPFELITTDVPHYDEFLIDEFLKFMTVRRDTPLTTVFQPSPLIDEVWHSFILMTSDYRKFCKEVFGGFLDHVPGDGTGHFGINGTYENTITAYEKRFGKIELKPDINPDPESDFGLLLLVWPRIEMMNDSDACTGAGSDGGCGSCG